MKIGYISKKENKKEKIETKQLKNEYEIHIPNLDSNRKWKNYLCYKLLERNMKKLVNKLDKDQVEYIMLSDDIKNNEVIAYLEKRYKTIGQGYLNSVIYEKIIEYIAGKKEIELRQMEIHICINKQNKFHIQMLEHLSQKVKSMNIITNKIKDFQRMEETLYEEKGVNITVTNNRRKSLAKADIIINLDFVQEQMEKFHINRGATFISLDHEIKMPPSFEGICIKNIKLKYNKELYGKINKENKRNKYKINNLIEIDLINENNTFYNCLDYLKKYEIEIEELVGNKGYINTFEYSKTG